ncbi:MAG: hypothetical protein ABEJ99_01465 [Candidatus Nanohaloarchaea archaeon]
MLLVFSHVLAFAVLFLAAVFDLKTTEVPDWVSIIGVVGGVLLHLAASIPLMDLAVLGNFGILLSDPVSWLMALGAPLLWSLGVGMVFSLYGWGIYYFGMWGGADAFAMSVLGFAAPTALNGFSLIYPVNIFLNMLLAGFLYTLFFGFYKAYRNPESLTKTYSMIKEDEKRVAVEVLLAGAFAAVGEYTASFNGLLYFGLFVSMIFLYRFFRVVQDDLMSHMVSVKDLEGGEVIAKEHGGDRKIVGITEEDIEELETDEVEVQEGIRFVPIFPIALVITDLLGGGIYWLFWLTAH